MYQLTKDEEAFATREYLRIFRETYGEEKFKECIRGARALSEEQQKRAEQQKQCYHEWWRLDPHKLPEISVYRLDFNESRIEKLRELANDYSDDGKSWILPIEEAEDGKLHVGAECVAQVKGADVDEGPLLIYRNIDGQVCRLSFENPRRGLGFAELMDLVMRRGT